MEEAKEEADDDPDPEDGDFEIEEMEAGDEFMAVKPWLGAMKEPSDFEETFGLPLKVGFLKKPPMAKLELEYCHGYRAKDCRNNLRYVKDGKVIYHAAAVGIKLDAKKNKQTFFNDHTDDITAFAYHEKSNRVATGELGKTPLVQVWDAKTMKRLATWKGMLNNGIAALAFSPNGHLLVAVGCDQKHHVAVLDVRKKVKSGGKGKLAAA